MKFQAATLALLPVLTMSTAVVPRAVPTGPWSGGAWKIAIGTDLFFFGEALNAADGRFWLHRDPKTYCPTDVEGLDCSQYNNGTAFLGGNDTVSLYTGVPGVQQGKLCQWVR
jgi:hypothetical protein